MHVGSGAASGLRLQSLDGKTGFSPLLHMVSEFDRERVRANSLVIVGNGSVVVKSIKEIVKIDRL